MADADESFGLIQLEHFLRTQLNELKEEKSNRMREVLELKPEDEALLAYCEELRGMLADQSAFGEKLRVLLDTKPGKAAAKRWDEITDSLDRKKQIEMLRDESRF